MLGAFWLRVSYSIECHLTEHGCEKWHSTEYQSAEYHSAKCNLRKMAFY
jgi:hypothetical protein